MPDIEVPKKRINSNAEYHEAPNAQSMGAVYPFPDRRVRLLVSMFSRLTPSAQAFLLLGLRGMVDAQKDNQGEREGF